MERIRENGHGRLVQAISRTQEDGGHRLQAMQRQLWGEFLLLEGTCCYSLRHIVRGEGGVLVDRVFEGAGVCVRSCLGHCCYERAQGKMAGSLKATALKYILVFRSFLSYLALIIIFYPIFISVIMICVAASALRGLGAMVSL